MKRYNQDSVLPTLGFGNTMHGDYLVWCCIYNTCVIVLPSQRYIRFQTYKSIILRMAQSTVVSIPVVCSCCVYIYRCLNCSIIIDIRWNRGIMERFPVENGILKNFKSYYLKQSNLMYCKSLVCNAMHTYCSSHAAQCPYSCNLAGIFWDTT